MEENQKPNVDEVQEVKDEQINEESREKTFSQKDLDNLASKIRSEEKSKQERLIQEAIAEHDRKAKLTIEEREKEEKTERENALKQREESILLRERTMDAKELLNENGLSSNFVNFVLDKDTEVMKQKIEDLKKEIEKGVSSGVEDKLKGQPPKDFSSKEPKPIVKTNNYGIW